MIEGWNLVIGIEIHAQVNSKSKLFSSSPTDFGSKPNSQVSLIDAAMPGMLPVINNNIPIGTSILRTMFSASFLEFSFCRFKLAGGYSIAIS